MAHQPNEPGVLGRLYQRITQFVRRDLWRFDSSQVSKFRSFLIHNAQLIFLVIRGSRQHRCTTRAAALTFITVFGLVPFMAVTLSVMSGFADLKAYEDGVIDYVIERIMPAVGSRGAPAGGAAAQPEDRRESLRNKIKHFVGNVRHGRIGTLASVFCMVIFFQLLSSIEAAFNNIWGVRRQRTFFQKLRAYWMLAIVPLLIAAYVASVTSIGGRLAGSPILSRAFTLISEVGFVWLVFLSLYSLLPNTHVRFGPAASAALFSALLLQLLKQSTLLATWLFGYRAETLAEIYGTSVAAIPMFLFVIFVLWVIALFGAELSYAGQNVRSYARDRRTLGLNQRSRERLGLRLLLEVAKRFDRGEPAPSTTSLSDEFDVSLSLVGDTLDLFERENLVRSSGEGAEATWQPARPLGRVPAAAAIDSMRTANGEELALTEAGAPGRYLSELVSEAESRSASVFEGVTLRDVLDRAEDGGASSGQDG